MRRQILSVGMAPDVDERRADAAMPEVGLDPVVDLLDHDTGAALLEAARCLSGKGGWDDPAAVLHSAALLVGGNRPTAPLDAARRLLADLEGGVRPDRQLPPRLEACEAVGRGRPIGGIAGRPNATAPSRGVWLRPAKARRG